MAIIEQLIVPAEGPNDETACVTQQLVGNGEKVGAGKLLGEFETAKAVLQITCSKEGYIFWCCAEGDEIPVGSCLAEIHDVLPAQQGLPAATAAPVAGQPVCSRSARALMEQHGIELTAFNGQPMVTERDVRALLAARVSVPVDKTVPAATSTDAVPLARDKRAEIRHLSSGQNQITSLFAAKLPLPMAPVKTAAFAHLNSRVVPLLLAGTCRLLREYREYNAWYDEGVIRYYPEINLGYALDLEQNLRVAALGDCSAMPLPDISRRIVAASLAYRRQELTAELLAPTTFTVSDVSTLNVAFFTPLINCRQSAILGIASPDAHEGCMTLVLVFDHRVSTGRRAALFLRDLVGMVSAQLTNAGGADKA